MKHIKTEKALIKSWCNDPEEGALLQAKNVANLPFIFKHVCLMPDTHQGYGMPIGGVIACKDVIIPNAVGVDIGCGMCAVQTTFNGIPQPGLLKEIMGKAREAIPLGVGRKYKSPCEESEMPKENRTKFLDSIYTPARYQLGTLGSGNHFIELQLDEEKNLWIMVHSGSRHLGHTVCSHYNKIAKKFHQKKGREAPKDLAWLRIDSPEGKEYITDMKYAISYAFLNRQKMISMMMDIVKDSFLKHTGEKVEFSDIINIHHNYANFEKHFHIDVWIHRKGATSAREGEIGVIPGSQGDFSYIVRGKGNEESFMSCSHGAGRRLSRSKAIRELDLAKEIRAMDDKGILHSVRHRKSLDEAPGAYKDIDRVMEEQKDLVEIIVKLTPLAVVKG